MSAYGDMDVVIKAAAVADYRPRDVADQKIKKKTDDALTVVMDKNPDILKELGARKAHQILVGFAAETQNLLEYAKTKLEKKQEEEPAAPPAPPAPSAEEVLLTEIRDLLKEQK